MGQHQRIILLAALVLLSWGDAAVLAGTRHLIRFIQPGQISGYALETMQFSPDGSLLAVATTDGVVSLISPEEGKTVGKFEHQPFSMSFSKDGSRLLMIGRDRTELLDMKAGIPTEIDNSERNEKGVIGISINLKDGKLVITNVRPGSPAEKVGTIAIGDELVGVAAGKGGKYQRVIGLSVDRTLELLRGRPGEYVRLKTLPKGTIEDREVLLRRAALRTTPSGTQLVPFEEAVVDECLAWCLSEDTQAFYNAKNGKLVSSFRLVDLVNDVGWHTISPDNKHFAFLGPRVEPNRKTFAIEIFEIGTRERIAFHSNIESRNGGTDVPVSAFSGFQYSPNGRYFLVGSWSGIQVISSESGKELHQVDTREGATEFASRGAKLDESWRMSAFTLSSRGLLAVGVGKGNVRLFDFNTGKYLQTLSKLDEDNELITGIAFSPNGKWLAYYVKDHLHLVDVEEFNKQLTPDPKPVSDSLRTPDVAYSRADRIENGTQGRQLWSLITHDVQHQRAPGVAISDELVAFSCQRRNSYGGRSLANDRYAWDRIVTKSNPKAAVMMLIRAHDGKPIPEFLESQRGESADVCRKPKFTPDGSKLLALADPSVGAGMVAIWDVRKKALLFSGKVKCSDIAVHPSSEFVACIDPRGELVWYDLMQMRRVHRFPDSRRFRCETLAFSKDGNTLAIADVACDLKSQTMKEIDQAKIVTPQLTVVHDSEIIQCGGYANEGITAWNFESLSVRVPFEAHPLVSPDVGCHDIAIVGNGVLATACDDGHIRLWEIESGKLLTMLTGHTAAVLDIDVDQKGSRLVSVSKDGTVKMWDVSKVKDE